MIHTEQPRQGRLRPAPLLVLTTAVVAAASFGFLNLCTGCSPEADRAAAALAAPDGSGGADARRDATRGDATEARVDDAILHFEIKAKLLGTLGWDAVNIDIDALDGRVLLTGQVPDRSSRELAEEIVRSVDGVDEVDSRLTLEAGDEAPPTGQALDDHITEAEQEVRDALLASRLKAKLLEEIGRHALDVEIDAANGVVTLRGRLGNDAQERIVLETVSKSPGVKRVVNLLETCRAKVPWK